VYGKKAAQAGRNARQENTGSVSVHSFLFGISEGEKIIAPAKRFHDARARFLPKVMSREGARLPAP